MELQGNIRVFCRVRPVLESEKMSIFDTDVVSYPSAGQLQIVEDKKNGRKPKKKNFEFDRIFNATSSQV